MLVFDERKKTEYPGKNLSERSREPTNSTRIWQRVNVARESRPGHNDGRRVLSLLRQDAPHTIICFSVAYLEQ